MTDRISQLESIAEECEKAWGEAHSTELAQALWIAAAYFTSKANTLRKVYRVEEETR